MYKFGEIRFCDPAVYDVRMCTVGVNLFTGVSLATFVRERHCYALLQSVIGCVSFLFARGRATLRATRYVLPRTVYLVLLFASHINAAVLILKSRI